MRITLDIDDDVLEAANRLAAKEKSTIGHVISDLARKALNLAAHQNESRGGAPLLPSRGDTISVEHVRNLEHQQYL